MNDGFRNIEQIENVQQAIEDENNRKLNQEETLEETEKELEKIFKQLYRFYIELNPQETAEDDAQAILNKIKDLVTTIMEKIRLAQLKKDVVVSRTNLTISLITSFIITVSSRRRN